MLSQGLFTTKEEKDCGRGRGSQTGELRGYRVAQLERFEKQNHKRPSQTEPLSHDGDHHLKDRSEDAR